MSTIYKVLKIFYRILKKILNIKDPIYTHEEKKYSNYQIGKYTFGSPNIIYKGQHYLNPNNPQKPDNILRIGNFCSIARNVTFCLAHNHRTDWISTYPFHKYFKNNIFIEGYPQVRGDIIINNDVWIGVNAFFLAGVTVGNGAVIGACSVVTKDVPPYAIVAGIPAKIIKYRFDEEIIYELEKIKWWDWPIEKIIEESTLLQSTNIKEFINKHKKQ
jgi:virginiamycin A acetyltransferase